MGAVKQAVLLLLLGAVVSTRAGTPEECEALTKRLPTEEQDQIFGDWVLVWSVADGPTNPEVLNNTTSSHVELRLLSDNQTVLFHERNVYRSNISSCVSYILNMTVQNGSEHLTLQTRETKMEVEGVLQDYQESGLVDFYFSSPDSLQIVYKEEKGRFLLSYRREGHHQDVAEQKTFHNFLSEQAECLKFPKEKPYVYDGVSDFCHKKSAPEAKKEDS